MTNASPSVLFLSGAGLPAWIWDDVRSELAIHGHHSAVAARPKSHNNASLSDAVDAALDNAVPGNFIIVAHSIGGVVGAEITQRAPDRVAGFLGLSAVIPAANGSFVSAMPAPNRWILAPMLRIAGTRPPAKALRSGLCAGLPAETTDRIVDGFIPESKRLYLDRIATPHWPSNRGYVTTANDRELTLAMQRGFADRLGGDWSHELTTGHLPMLEAPAQTASVITSFAAR